MWTCKDADTKLIPSWLVGTRDAGTAYELMMDIASGMRGRVTGDPNARHISTSYVKRQNLTMRMSMHRFNCLTNAFSKKVENHAAAVALYFMYCNFARVHQTLRATPAMEASIEDHVWSIEEIVASL